MYKTNCLPGLVCLNVEQSEQGTFYITPPPLRFNAVKGPPYEDLGSRELLLVSYPVLKPKRYRCLAFISDHVESVLGDADFSKLLNTIDRVNF